MCTTFSYQTLSDRVKKEIKTFIEKLLVDNFTCSICLEILKEPVGLKCGHMYCSHCLLTWLNNHKTCPMCRFVTSSFATVKCDFMEKLIMEIKSTLAANIKRSPKLNIVKYDVKSLHKNVGSNNKKNTNQRPPWK